jgi:hypothetical protein
MGDSVFVLMLEPPSISTVLQWVASGQIDRECGRTGACATVIDRLLYSV